jgi:replicative DNA helicase
MSLNLEDCREFYAMLRHDNWYSDLRCIDVEKSKLVDRSVVKGWEDVEKWLKQFNGHGNCFIGRNPRESSEGSKVVKITTASFDIDSTYNELQPKSKGASQIQIANCEKAGREVIRLLKGGGLAFSGNGALVFYQHDGSFTTAGHLEKIEKRLRGLLEAKFDVVVDSTHDDARMVKFVGTLSCRGPRRLAKFWEKPQEPLSLDAIYAFISKYQVPETIAAEAMDTSKPIPHGQMHKNLVGFAGACRKRGLDADAIYKQLVIFAQARCAKPLDYARLLQIAKSMMKYEPDDVQTEPVVVNDSAHTVSSSFQAYRSQLLERFKSKTPELPTGYKNLDLLTWGMSRGDIYTVGGYTGEGKTTWCVNVAKTLCDAGKKVLYLSTELSYDRIFDKFIGISIGIPALHFQRGLTPEDIDKVDAWHKANGAVCPLTINDNVAPNIEEVRSLVEKNSPDVVIFDHIQQVGEGKARRNEAIALFLKQLQELAREGHFAVMVVSQFGRPERYLDYDTKTRKAVKTPTLYDFKECGAIENKSRVALLVYESGEAVDAHKIVMTFEVAKCSFGQTGKVEMIFDKNAGKFYEREAVNAVSA